MPSRAGYVSPSRLNFNLRVVVPDEYAESAVLFTPGYGSIVLRVHATGGGGIGYELDLIVMDPQNGADVFTNAIGAGVTATDQNFVLARRDVAGTPLNVTWRLGLRNNEIVINKTVTMRLFLGAR